MCGICGVVYADAEQPVAQASLIAMRDALTHRGPDDAGHYLGPGIGLGSRRLSVIDLSVRGHMPMSTPDGRFWIVYNGEVYNHAELREWLEARHHTFRSRTDTEVVLRLYQEEGVGMLERLNGMFAIAIWDSLERSLFLARDRLGIKPLHYIEQPEGLSFASEAKALFASGSAPEFERETWEELLCFRHVAGAETPFRGVKRLLPGHYLLWKDGSARIRCWWKLADRVARLREMLPDDPVGWFRETFDSAVRLRRISDVPVGVLLSGGLDSGSVAVSLASEAAGRVASFTVRFAEARYDEGPLAQEVAERAGLEHHTLTISDSDVMPLLVEASRVNDEPLVHGNDLHLLAISRYAKPRVTVLLSGEGGDELLGGYVRYRPLQHPGLLNAARPLLPFLTSALRIDGRLRKLGRFLSLGPVDRFVLFNACDVLPGDLESFGMRPTGRFPYRERILAEAGALYPNEPHRQAMYSDQHTHLCSILDRNDRMTMGASIECRVPFLDYRLVETLAALPSAMLFPDRQSKPLLRRSIGRRLPENILRHRKWGFGVPWGRYFRDIPEIREVVAELPSLAPVRNGPLEGEILRGAVESVLRGETRHVLLVKQLLMVVMWYRECARPQVPTVVR